MPAGEDPRAEWVQARAVVEALEGHERGVGDGGGFGGEVEAKLARRVVAPGEDTAFLVEREGVLVAGRDGGDVEALKGGDFVRLVVRAGSRAGVPAQAWDAHLSVRGELAAARGGAEEAAGGSQDEEVVEARGDGGGALEVGEVGRRDGTVVDAGGEGVEGQPPGEFRGLGAGELVDLGDGEGVDGAGFGEREDAVAGDGEGGEVLAREGFGGLLQVFGVAGAPLHEVAVFGDRGAKVAVEFDVAEEHLVEIGDSSWSFDDWLVRVRRCDAAGVGAPGIDAGVLPALLDLDVLRAYEVPVLFLG